MWQRCTNPNYRGWKNYGGRGIRVCERWETYENFLADMGEKPEGPERYSLDRYPDNNGNYEPDNCRWATYAQQAANIRTNVMVTINGETTHLSEMCRRHGANLSGVCTRVANGATPEEAILSSVRWRQRRANKKAKR